MSRAAPRGRRGRRPAGSDTRGEILAAARSQFAERGYDGTSMRAVARAAGVDPALVHHYFDGKDDLLVASLGVPVDVAALVERVVGTGVEGAGERLVRSFLEQWDDPVRRETLLGIFRSVLGNRETAVEVRELLLGPLLGEVTRRLGVADPPRSAALLASQMGGLALTRYLLRVEPLASLDADQLAADIGPTLQRYFEL